MKTITSRPQRTGRGSAFPMVAAGAASVLLFAVAVLVVGVDTASEKQNLSAQGATLTGTMGHGAYTTAGR